MRDAKAAAEAVFREESGRIIATLIRLSRDFDRAEEAMQEAFAAAMSEWPVSGIPQQPGAWITTVARRKLVDAIRRETTRERSGSGGRRWLMSLCNLFSVELCMLFGVSPRQQPRDGRWVDFE